MPELKITSLPDTVEDSLKGLKLGVLKKHCTSFFKRNINGKSAINKHKGITVLFNMRGLKHVLHARNSGYTKLKAVYILPELIENAVYCNFKNPGENDSPDIIGFLNFKSKAKIEGKIQIFRIVIRITNRGKFFYDHAVRVKK